MKGSKHYNGKRIQTRRRPFCTPKPDADLCMCMDLPLDKKLWKIRTGARWAVAGRGPLGLRAAGLSRAADLFLAKPWLRAGSSSVTPVQNV